MLKVGQKVWVRNHSMHELGYQDTPGVIADVLPGGCYNVVRESDGQPIAHGQPECGFKHRFGVFDEFSEPWMSLNEVL